MIADTSFLIDFSHGRKEAMQLYNKIKEYLHITAINKYEFLVGIARQSGINTDKRLVEAEEFLDNFGFLELDNDSLKQSALICGDLLKKGKQIDDNDCIIAGIALSNGFNKIITRNKSHFSRIFGIKIITY